MPILASLNAKNRPKSFINWNPNAGRSKGQFANSLLDSTSPWEVSLSYNAASSAADVAPASG